MANGKQREIDFVAPSGYNWVHGSRYNIGYNYMF